MVENVELYIIFYDFFLRENWPSLPTFKVKVLGKFEGAVEAIINRYIKEKVILPQFCSGGYKAPDCSHNVV